MALGLALLILVVLTVLGGFGRLGNTGFPELREADDAQVAAESAPSVAERAAEAILAYDHRSLDADQDAATRFMTDGFAEEYTTTFEKTVRPGAQRFKARVTAEVQGASVVRASADRVRVLLFVDQTTTSTARPRPQLALNRVEFLMEQQDGDWKVAEISSY